MRISIYTQTLISFAPPLIFVSDGFMDSDEEKLLQTIYSGLLLTSCSLLISAFIQAKTFGLSTHHALIVLNLSWMVNASALIVCIFPTINKKHPKDTWWRWLSRLWPTRLRQLLSAFLVVIHLCAMGCLGTWVWATRGYFGHSSLLAPHDCVPTTITTFFGHSILVTNERMRLFSLIFYSISMIPVVNVIIWTTLAVGGCVILDFFVTWLMKNRIRNFVKRRSLYIAAITIQFFVSARFVIDTELMIHRTAHEPGESQWTFGQTLAILLVIFPFFEVGKRGLQNRTGIKVGWWLRGLLSKSRRGWDELHSSAARDINRAHDLVSECLGLLTKQAAVKATGDRAAKALGATKSALGTTQAALGAAKTMLDAADHIIQAAAPVKEAPVDLAPLTQMPSLNAIEFKLVEHQGEGSRVPLVGRDAWKKFCLEVTESIDNAREFVIAAHSVRIAHIRDQFSLGTGGPPIEAAKTFLDAAEAGLDAANVPYHYYGPDAAQTSPFVAPTFSWRVPLSSPGSVSPSAASVSPSKERMLPLMRPVLPVTSPMSHHHHPLGF